MDGKEAAEKAVFRDSKGRPWSLVVSIGKAMALRDRLRLDVGSIVNEKGTLIKELLSDQWKFIQALELLVADQLEAQRITREDFLESLGGDVLDEAFDAMLWGISASLGKLQRRALVSMIPQIETGLAKMEAAIAARMGGLGPMMEKEIAKAVETSGGG